MAVVFVHGIGNQQHGSVLTQMAQPCVDALASLAHAEGYGVSQTEQIVPPHTDAETESSPRASLVTLTKGRRCRSVLFVEAVWSHCFARPRWWWCLWWALRNLPATVLLLGPDHRDAMAMNAHDPPPEASSLRRIRSVVIQALRPDFMLTDVDFVMFRFMWRAFVACLAIGLLVALVVGQPALGAVLVIALVIYLRSRGSVVGHVVVAASAPAELAKIRQRVSECLIWAGQRSERVVIVAHSQGGFVAHTLLSDSEVRTPQIARLIGVGSGLKPIWLLSQLNRRAVLLAAWISLATLAIGEALVLAVLAGSDAGLTSATRSTFEYFGMLVVPIGLMETATPSELMNDRLRDLEILPLHGVWDALGGLGPIHALGAALFIIGWLLTRRLWRRAYPGPEPSGLPSIPGSRWLELSSYHDPVGRMLFPTLPAPAEEEAVAVGGNPKDHVAYFSPASVVPWRIAGSLLDELGIRLRSPTAIVSDVLLASAARRRRLRGGVFATIIVITIFPAVFAGSSLVARLAAAASILLVASATLSVTFAQFEVAEQRRLVAALRNAVTTGTKFNAPPAPVSGEKRMLPTTLLMLLVIASLSAAIYLPAVIRLIDYPIDKSVGVAPLVNLTILAMAYLLAVGAGYRPNRWVLMAGVGLCCIWYLEVMRALPHDRSMADVRTIPGVMTVAAAAALCAMIVFLLRPKRVG